MNKNLIILSSIFFIIFIITYIIFLNQTNISCDSEKYYLDKNQKNEYLMNTDIKESIDKIIGIKYIYHIKNNSLNSINNIKLEPIISENLKKYILIKSDLGIGINLGNIFNNANKIDFIYFLFFKENTNKEIINNLKFTLKGKIKNYNKDFIEYCR